MQENSRPSINIASVLAYNTYKKMDRATKDGNKFIQALKSHRSQLNTVRHSKMSLYKTQMCHNIQTLGYCRFGSDCLFAHNTNELRSVPSNLPNTPQFSASSNVSIFNFELERFQQQQPCTSWSSVGSKIGDSALRMPKGSLEEEQFYKLFS